MKVVILLSKTFFAGHPKAGKPTYFAEKIDNNFRSLPVVISGEVTSNKIHTCRVNYSYWAKQIARLKEVGGVLSVRQWSGKPYSSTQEVIAEIPAEQVGVQRLMFDKNRDGEVSLKFFNIDGRYVELEALAKNDGLSVEDFRRWFRRYDLSEPLAIIHFTEFRYGK